MNIGKELDKVLYYVCDNLSTTNYGKKDIVISATLHDLMEDTNVAYDNIKNEKVYKELLKKYQKIVNN